MKNFRSTLIFLGIAALLGGYIYFFERGPVKKDDEKDKDKNKVFANFVADDIHEIRVEHLSTTITAEKAPIDIQKDDKGNWRIMSPQNFPADENTVHTMLTSLAGLNPDSVIDKPANLADFGLNSPTARCSFFPKTGAPSVLLIGDKNPTGNSYYIKAGDKPPVYLVGAYPTENFKKDINDYRDRSFFKTDTIVANKIRVTRDGKVVVFEKNKDNAWDMTEPMKSKADESKIRDLLNQVSNLRITDFVDDHPTNLNMYGLNKPHEKVEVWEKNNQSPKAVLIGRKKLKTTAYFAKSLDAPSVYTTADYFEKTLDLKISDYRDKGEMRFDNSLAKGMTILHNQKTFVYQKDAKGQWTSPGRPNAGQEAANLLGQLAGTNPSDFAPAGADTGLEDPSYVVEIPLTDGTTRTFRFGKKLNAQIYLASDKSKEIFLVPAGVVSQMDDYYNSVLTPVPVSSPAPPHP
jgi:hypothetical protein